MKMPTKSFSQSNSWNCLCIIMRFMIILFIAIALVATIMAAPAQRQAIADVNNGQIGQFEVANSIELYSELFQTKNACLRNLTIWFWLLDCFLEVSSMYYFAANKDDSNVNALDVIVEKTKIRKKRCFMFVFGCGNGKK